MLVSTEDDASLVTVDELFAAQKAQLLAGKLLANEEKLAAAKV